MPKRLRNAATQAKHVAEAARRQRAVLSETVTHTHYTVGDATYSAGDGTEADALVAARTAADASGLPVRRCRWVHVLYEGLRAARHKTVWDVVG